MGAVSGLMTGRRLSIAGLLVPLLNPFALAGGEPGPPHVIAIDPPPGTVSQMTRISFTFNEPVAEAANNDLVFNNNAVQFIDDPATGTWIGLTEVVARNTNRVEVILDPQWRASRFYRVITPAQALIRPTESSGRAAPF